MELLDFITVLSIFLDNAIEASLDSSTKEVNVALISGETKVVIVENTIAQEYQGEVGKKAENLIQRQFEASKPMEKCYTDVTEFAIPASSQKL
ncbi:GHKL domain-containing protein, partial [Streptococcus salivarius]